MSLPGVLYAAPVVWRPTLPLDPAAPTCNLTCYQPVLQCQTFWCWAAVLQELLRCLKGQVYTQCQLAEELLCRECDCSSSSATACNPTIQSPCNTTGVLEEYLGYLWPVLSSSSASGLTRDLLRRALCNERPVVGLFIKNNQHHYTVLSGLATINGQDFLEVTDPKGARQIGGILFTPGTAVKHPDGWYLNHAFFI